MGDKCKSYIPFEKFTRGDLDDIIHAFHTKFVNSDGPDWDWMEHMAYDSVNDEMGFKNGASCIGERGTGKQVFAIEIGEIDNFNYGWWHQGAFEATSQPFSQNPHGTCQKHKIQSRSLVVYACAAQPVDGSWGAWSGYGECNDYQGLTVRCNEAGKQIRSRSCDSPAPAHGGSRCQKTNGPLDTSEEQISDCSGYCPPIDGGFTDWSSWGQCSEPCGQGDHSRTRTCTNPAPQHGGAA